MSHYTSTFRRGGITKKYIQNEKKQVLTYIFLPTHLLLQTFYMFENKSCGTN